jgi:hypothetical protein
MESLEVFISRRQLEERLRLKSRWYARRKKSPLVGKYLAAAI